MTNEGWRLGTVDGQLSSSGQSANVNHSSFFSSADRLSGSGNPDGYLGYTESSAPDTFGQFKLVQFVSPTTWATDWSGNYGGPLSLDFRTNSALPIGNEISVEILQGSTRYVTRIPPLPEPDTWTSYSVPLHEFFWSQCTSENVCSAITKAAFKTMLASTSATKTLRIYATYTSTNGEKGDLDNPRLAEDNSPPETVHISGASGPTNDTTPTFSFNASGEPATSMGNGDDYVQFECALDPTAPDFELCGGVRPLGDDGTYSPGTPLSDGTYTFQVRASDLAENSDPTPVTRTFTVDTVAPVVEITDRPKDRVRTRKRKVRVTFLFQANEQSSFSCKLDSRAATDCSFPQSYRVARGKHTFTVTGTDAAGNAASASDSFKVVRKR